MGYTMDHEVHPREQGPKIINIMCYVPEVHRIKEKKYSVQFLTVDIYTSYQVYQHTITLKYLKRILSGN